MGEDIPDKLQKSKNQEYFLKKSISSQIFLKIPPIIQVKEKIS